MRRHGPNIICEGGGLEAGGCTRSLRSGSVAGVPLFCRGCVRLGKRYDINIPALKADAALKTLARQAETQLLFSYDYVKAIQANPVSGRYTLSEALEMLLQGTGLSSSLTKGGVITVAPAQTTAEQDAEQEMNGRKKLSLLGSIAAFLGMTISPHAVWAAEPAVGLEEIIVTASRQGAQSIQDLPMSISAVNTAALETLGQSGLDDLTRGIPSVSMQSSGPGRNKIDIRGITTGGFRLHRRAGPAAGLRVPRRGADFTRGQ